jgi:hypothetical protein
MKINYERLIVFILLFMITQYILLWVETKPYLDMASEIQGYKFNFYKNEKNEISLKQPLVHTIVYLALVLFFYLYFKFDEISYIDAFIIIVTYYTLWDSCLYIMFDKGVYHWKVLLYDIFVVGGGGIVLTKYIINNYYKFMNIPLLFIIYLITMINFLYKLYKYNPDIKFTKVVLV